ncbi:DUF3800 domain-containing protein [Thermus thalpophilus]|nr:DUF3800 domain-containing protein [Thermus thalpophilus]
MLLCFLDESGDHVLKKVDPQYPVFVLAGVLVEPSHYREAMYTSKPP